MYLTCGLWIPCDDFVPLCSPVGCRAIRGRLAVGGPCRWLVSSCREVAGGVSVWLEEAGARWLFAR
jgi:hypothetical protein